MDLNAGKLSGDLTLDTSKFTGALHDAVNAATTGAGSLQKALGQPFAPAAAEASKLTSSVGGLTSALRIAAGDAGTLNSATVSLNSTLGTLLSTAAGTAFGGLFSGAIGAATSLAGTLAGIVVTGVKLSAQAESTSLALSTMIGDSTTAATLLKDLRTFANSTPFEFPELANAAKQLLAMGINAQDVVGTLRMLGDVSSGLGQPVGEMAYLFGQIRSQGRAMTQDLNQFASRGVPIYAELAKVLKTDELGVRSLAENGEISFARINQAFASMTAEGGKFFDMTKSQAETAQGLFSTLQDSIGDVETQIGSALTRGTDGKSLRKEITAEVDKLKPSLVEMGVALAAAFKTALPYLKTTADYLQVVLDKLDLIDLNKIYGNPYDGATDEKVATIRGASDTPDALPALGRIQDGVSKGAGNAAAALRDLSKWSTHDAGLENQSAFLAARVDEASKMFAAIRDKRARGEALSDQEFQEAKDQVAGSLKGLGLLQESINKAMPDLQNLKGLHGEASGQERANAALAQIRAAQIDAQRALAELTKAAADDKAKVAADTDKAKVGEWINPAASSPAVSPPGGAAPATNGQPSSDTASPTAGTTGAGGTAGKARGGGSYDLAAELEKVKLARLMADGKKEEAALLEAKIARDREYARIEAASNGGNLSFGDSIYASRAVAEQYEIAVKGVRDRFAKDRADQREKNELEETSTAARVRDYSIQAETAVLEAQGRTKEAALLRFDAEWRKRLDAIKGDAERAVANAAYVAERARKVQEAQPAAEALPTPATPQGATVPAYRQRRRDQLDAAQDGTLARLNARDAAGPLTADERARRDRLQREQDLRPARRRVENAKQGSGERETARLDLREALGKLNVRSPEPFRVPSPLAGLAGLAASLAPTRPGGADGSTPPASPVVKVNPSLQVDTQQLAKACLEAMEPVMDRKIADFANGLRDRNHAFGVAGRI